MTDKQRQLIVAVCRKLGDGTREAKLIMEYLEQFCFDNRTTYVKTMENMAVNEGRRQVLVEIRRLIKEGEQL